MAAVPPSVRGAHHRRRRRHLATALVLIGATSLTVALMRGWMSPSEMSPPTQPPTDTRTEAKRIVSFVPAATEMLFAMGAGERVVGVSRYDRFPGAVRGLPAVGGLLDPNVERVLSLRPDLVVVYSTQHELRDQLNRAGIPQYQYVHRDLADVTDTIRAIGARLHLETAANRLASDIEQQLEQVRRRVAGRPRPRTLVVFGRETGSLRRIHASGGYGFLHDLVELAGGDDVLGDVKRESVELSAESVLSRAPQVIVELKYGQILSLDAIQEIRMQWSALPGVPAVRSGRVAVMVGDEFVVPGPRVVLAAERLAERLHPESAEAERP